MQIARAAIESYVSTLPEIVESEDVMYRLYLLEKIEAGERDIQAGRFISHNEASERLAGKWSV